MNIKKYSTVFILIFLHNVFMQGADSDENSPLLPTDAKSIPSYTQDNLKSHIKIEKAKFHAEKETRRIQAERNAAIKAELKGTLIKNRDRVLWNCHYLLSNIAADKDKNIATLKSVITQIRSIKVDDNQDGVYASIPHIDRFYYGGHHNYIYEMANAEKSYFLYPSPSPSHETVKYGMQDLQNHIAKHLKNEES